MITKQTYEDGIRCRGICSLCNKGRENCYQYIIEVKDKNDEFTRLDNEYKISCRKELKKEMTELVDKFIDDDSIDNEYKQKIINMITTLISLK